MFMLLAGVRIFYLDEKMKVKSHLLAVKLFRPSPLIAKKVTGKVVLKWLRQVLGQFGLTMDDLAGAVTDAGSDVKSGVGSACKWEWCIPHLLNRVTTDGAGMSQAASQSKNPPCRGLMDLCKKVVEHHNKSPAAKVLLCFHDILFWSVTLLAECNKLQQPKIRGRVGIRTYDTQAQPLP